MRGSCGPVGIGQVVSTNVVLCLPLRTALSPCASPSAVIATEKANPLPMPRSQNRQLAKFVGFACLLATLSIPPAIAQTQQQIDWCNGKDSTDVRIGGCTAMIESGKFTGKDLAIIFNLRGKAHADRSDIELAVTDYDQAIRLDPQYALAFTNRGRVYFKKKEYVLAIEDYAKSAALDPNNADPWAYQGDAYYDMGQTEQAIESFAEAIKRDPKWIWPYTNRGELYLDRGDYDLALKDFDQVVKWSPTHAMGWNDRCRAFAIVGRLEQALNDCSAQCIFARLLRDRTRLRFRPAPNTHRK
jgi:tetratricopeptide (TPR) repeat protein